jgi:hypothetical protein
VSGEHRNGFTCEDMEDRLDDVERELRDVPALRAIADAAKEYLATSTRASRQELDAALARLGYP